MYINEEQRLAYVAHPRTASRETAKVLRARGFRKFCGHHGVPWGPGMNVPKDRVTHPNPDTFWWFGQPVHFWTIVSTVRNHWDTFASLTIMFPRQTQNPHAFLKWLWEMPHFYRNRHIMWPTIHEFPERQLRVLRFESLRDDLSAFLADYGLNPLNDDEFIHETSDTRTPTKEIGEWRGVISPEMAEWVAANYEWEISHLGYEF